jgi:hypothetical protein
MKEIKFLHIGDVFDMAKKAVVSYKAVAVGPRKI